MAKATRHDYQNAITDYSAAIESTHIPPDVKAMAVYNRALAYSAIHEDAKAAADLADVLKMPGLPENIRIHAYQRSQRLRQRKEAAGGP